MTQEEILGMEAEQLDEAICNLMEPKPTQTKTYAEFEKEDGGNYTCWAIWSPGGWWEINFDYHNMRASTDYVPQWEPAKHPAEEENIEAAWEVVDKLKGRVDSAFGYHLLFVTGLATCKESAYCPMSPDITVTDLMEKLTPEAICKAALLVATEATNDHQNQPR